MATANPRYDPDHCWLTYHGQSTKDLTGLGGVAVELEVFKVPETSHGIVGILRSVGSPDISKVISFKQDCTVAKQRPAFEYVSLLNEVKSAMGGLEKGIFIARVMQEEENTSSRLTQKVSNQANSLKG